MLVISFNLSQSFNCAPYLFCKKQFKSEINCFCIGTQQYGTQKYGAPAQQSKGSDSMAKLAAATAGISAYGLWTRALQKKPLP
jgi:hypothetical protein